MQFNFIVAERGMFPQLCTNTAKLKLAQSNISDSDPSTCLKSMMPFCENKVIIVVYRKQTNKNTEVRLALSALIGQNQIKASTALILNRCSICLFLQFCPGAYNIWGAYL